MFKSVMGRAKPPIVEAPLEQRIRHGAWAMFLVPVGSLMLQAVRGDPPVEWISLLEIPIVGALAWGLYRRSRAAVVAIILYLLAVGVVQFMRFHSLPIGPYIILAFFFGRAIPAVFRYHRAGSGSSAHAP